MRFLSDGSGPAAGRFAPLTPGYGRAVLRNVEPSRPVIRLEDSNGFCNEPTYCIHVMLTEVNNPPRVPWFRFDRTDTRPSMV
jgi:hypothetical protein